ncbi:MAG TPA: HNH endonuclease signature motif containing protein [Terriglobia bacterium]|nr:HNH endonuclease signature motif containing protein [Terriglobia bacterium]
MHKIVFDCMLSGIRDHNTIVEKLKANERLAKLNDVTNLPVKETKRKRFSKSVQVAAVVRQILKNRERCTECGARLPPGSRSKDHKTGRMEGGTGTVDNLGFTHPYCNTGYKQKRLAMAE